MSKPSDEHFWHSVRQATQGRTRDWTTHTSDILILDEFDIYPHIEMSGPILNEESEELDRYLRTLWPTLKREPDTREVIEYPEKRPEVSMLHESRLDYSPSISLIERVRFSNLSLHDLHWRQLEELVAELLIRDGYHVQLGRGTKDAGVDIIAMKQDPITGFFLSVWQAKKLQAENKVDLHVIRELADTRVQHNATKGIIVTTTSLTKGALARVEQDRYLLGKVDGNDLSSWIQKGK